MQSDIFSCKNLEKHVVLCIKFFRTNCNCKKKNSSNFNRNLAFANKSCDCGKWILKSAFALGINLSSPKIFSERLSRKSFLHSENKLCIILTTTRLVILPLPIFRWKDRRAAWRCAGFSRVPRAIPFRDAAWKIARCTSSTFQKPHRGHWFSGFRESIYGLGTN